MEHFADVDAYLERAEFWPDEIRALRPVLRKCGLTEEIKWGKPTYSHDGRNILILQEMKGFLAVMFFKGALLTDDAGVLHSQGPNSRSAKRMQITSTADVKRLAPVIRAYVDQAIAVEDAGLEPAPAEPIEHVPELHERFARDDEFRAAFQSLTPGRQREYHLHFSQAKQPATRAARIDKYADKIRGGKGMRDR